MKDTTQTDELGQPLLRGPYATLDTARSAIAEARKVTVLRPETKRKVNRSRSRS